MKRYGKSHASEDTVIPRLFLTLLAFGIGFAAAQETATDYIQGGNDYLSAGDCQFAQYYFQEALDLEADNIDAALGKGRALVCQGAYPTGIEEFQRVIGLNPSSIKAHIYLAQAYRSQYESDPNTYGARLSDALGIVENAEQIDANNPELLNVKGVVFFRLGNMEEARTALERAVTLSSEMSTQDQATMQINLGKTYLQLDEMDLALQAFKRAVSLDPANASAHNNVGATYFALGDCEQGIYELTQAVNLQPNSVDAAFNLGRALFDCEQVDASVPRFEAAIEVPGALNIPELYTYLSRAYVLQGRFDEAVVRAQQGALLPPTTAEALFHLGQAYEARGRASDTDDAIEAYKSALELDPEFSAAQTALERLQ